MKNLMLLLVSDDSDDSWPVIYVTINNIYALSVWHEENMNSTNLKVEIVGDGAVGKESWNRFLSILYQMSKYHNISCNFLKK